LTAFLDLSMTQGDTVTYRATLNDGDTQQPVDDPQALYVFTAKYRSSDVTPVFTVGPETQAEPGVAYFTIPTEATATIPKLIRGISVILVYDVRVTEHDGTVTTTSAGQIAIAPRLGDGS